MVIYEPASQSIISEPSCPPFFGSRNRYIKRKLCFCF